jgi:hypothetical protein
MKKITILLIITICFASLAPEAKGESLSTAKSASITYILLGKNGSVSSQSSRVKKRTAKKLIRKVARVYRTGKTDRNAIKKSRKIQRQATRIINIF